MTQQYDIVFPARGRQTIDGGLSNKFDRSIIPDTASPDCLNVVFTNGAAETRGGITKLNTTAIGSFVGDGLYVRHDNTGAETMVAFAGGTAWALTGASTFATIPSAQSVFTAGVRVGAAEFENHLFIGNGGIASPYKYNGTAFTRHGVPAPTTTATVASGAAGNLIGVYSWQVTFVNSASVEGNVSPAVTFTVTASGGQASLSNIPVGAAQSHGVNSRYIYRTNAGGSTYYRIATIADNTTTIYTDNIASSAAGVAAPTDNGLPPSYNSIVAHQGRLWMNDPANPNYVWYSGALEPYTVGAAAFIPVGDATFDIVRGITVYNNNVVVLCNTGVYLIVTPTTDPTDWSAMRTRSQFGSKSPYGTFLYDDKIMFPALQSTKFAGFAALSGAALDPEATKLEFSTAGSELKSDRIEPDMLTVPETYAGFISATVYQNKAYVALPYGTSQTSNNRIYVFDFSISNLSTGKHEAWVPYTGASASQMCVYNGNLYFIDATATGFVRQLGTANYNDDSAAINSYFWTKEFTGLPGHENMQKDFRWVKILVEKSGSYYMNMSYRVDSDSGVGLTKQVSLSSNAATWNSLVWGSGLWGSGRAQDEFRVTLGQVSGKRIQLKFSNQNTANQKFKLLGLNIGYNVKGKR
jgi:hypothetical protein